MKIILKNARFILVALLFGFVLTACENDDDAMTDDVMETNTIADFVSNNENYSSLAAALDAAGLTATLNGSTNYTVFAPDNDAFAAFLSDNGFASLDEVPLPVLTAVLMNHVQTGNIMSTDLTTGYIQSMATGNASSEPLSMYINTTDGVTINGVSSVTTADIQVDNGVIHAVDAVIGLPDVVTFATADPMFSTLVTALTREDDFTFVGTLMETDTPAPFTVFAPTNAAFGDLLTELEASSLDDIDAATLEAVLGYHVVAGANVRSSAVTDDMTVATLGGDFIINTENGAVITDDRGRTSEIIAFDVQANNGVIHAIDTVLLPSADE